MPNTLGLSHLIEEKLKHYFNALKGERPLTGLYEEIIREVERPLIQCALDSMNGNKLQAANLLGINRNTLRKKIQELQIDEKKR